MLQKIKQHIIACSALIMLVMPGAIPAAVAYAANCPTGDNIAQGANLALSGSKSGTVSCQTGVNEDSSIGALAQKAVNIFSMIVGVVAVIMIIYGGFRYITSGGDSGSVGTAKNTLIYAIVGLIIVALAQFIVHFVLNQTSSVSQ